MKIRYWRKSRSGYERLDGSAKKSNSDPTRKRRMWRRIKIVPKLRVLKKTTSLITRLRDSYVNMMLRLANSRATGPSHGYGPREYYDEKKLVEIYKSMLMAQGGGVPRAPKCIPQISSESIL